ncbi:Type 3 secretion system secretin [subsurface metagenome]
MIVLENILSQEIVQKLGWTLLHFVWQAAVVALLLAILLKVMRKSTANLRYIIACLALTLIVLLPVITIQLVPVSVPQSAGHIEPAPAPAVLSIEEMPAAETIVLEEPMQLESVAPISADSWKQRTIETLEPALPYIVSGWLLGVFGLSLWHLGGWAQLQRLKRRMVKQVDDALHNTLKVLAQRLRVNRTVQLMESALVQIPTVVGWLRPVILLPASALTGLSSEQLEAILAHELAHIKRYDYLVNILQTVVEILGFYHPAVWWVSHKIRAERENCCDDLAVSISGDRVCYARALTSMEEIRAGHGQLAVAATGGNLLGRIRRLVGKDAAEKTSFTWIPAVTVILLIIALAIPTTLALTNKSDSLQAVPKTNVPLEDKKTESAHKLKLLGLAVAMYANDHDENLPDSLKELKPYIRDEQDFNWLLENIKYLGSGKSAQRNAALIPIAYDRELLEEADGTNVLSLDFSVRFLDTKEFEKLDIKRAEFLIEVRFLSVSEDFLQNIGLNANSPDEAKDLFKLKSEMLAASDGFKTQSLILDERNVSLLLEAVHAHKDSKGLATPQVICQEDKTAEIRLFNSLHFISGYTEPNRPSDKPEPKYDSVKEGIFLSLKPKLTTKNNVDLEFELEITQVPVFEERQYKGKYPYKHLTVQKTTQATRYIAHNGQTLLCWGHKISKQQEGRTEMKDLLVLIKAETVGSSEQDKSIQVEDLTVAESGKTASDVIMQPGIGQSRIVSPNENVQESDSQVWDDILLATEQEKESSAESIPVPVPAKSPTPSAEDKAHVQVDCLIVEVSPDLKMDRETTIQAENLLGNKISLRDTKVDVLLRKAAGATAATKDKSAENKRVTEQEFNALVDMLTSKGYMKILMNPTIEVINGKTARISSSQHVPLQKITKTIPGAAGLTTIVSTETEYIDVADSIEITPHVFADGHIILQVEATISSKSIPKGVEQIPTITTREVSTLVTTSPGESLIIGGLKETGKSSETDRNVKGPKEKSKEVLFIILTPTIISPSTDSQEKADTQIEVKKVLSADKLKQLGLAVAMYADDHDDNLPDSLRELKPYIRDEQDFNWLLDNIKYFGSGKSAQRNAALIPIAYDRELLEEANGTNVLSLDFSVRFLDTKEFEKLDIKRADFLIKTWFLAVNKDFIENINHNADSPDEAKELFKLKSELLAAVDGSNKLSFSFIPPERNVSLLLKAVRAHKDSKVLAAPQVICLEDKTAKIEVMNNETYYIVGYTEPNSPSEKPQPKLEKVEEGIALSLRPNLTPNNNIDMQFEFQISKFLDSEERKFQGKAPYKPPKVQRTAQSLAYRVLNGQTLLFGGHKIADQQDGRTEQKDLLILIKAHTIGSSEQDKPAMVKYPIVTKPPRTTIDVITKPAIAKSRTERPEDNEQEQTKSATEQKPLMVQKIFKLKHHNSSQMGQIILPLVGEYGHISADERTNNLLVIDTTENLTRIEKIIAQFDVSIAEQAVQKSFKLKYRSPSQMAQILRPLLTKTGHVSADESTRILLLIDTPENLKRIEKIIAAFDVSKAKPTVTEIFKIRYGDPVEIVELLKKLINGPPGFGSIIEPGKEPIVLVPEPSRKWIIAKASAENMKQIGQWIEKLDREELAPTSLEQIDQQIIKQQKILKMRQEYINNDPVVKAISENVAKTEAELIAARQKFAQSHPKVRQKDRVLQLLKKRLNDMITALGKSFDDMMLPEPNLPLAPEVPLITNTWLESDMLEVLQDIALMAGIPIIPDETVVGSVTAELKDVPLDTALDIVLAGTPYVVKKTPYYYLVASALEPPEIQRRVYSAKKLSNLGKALLIYANDHEDKYPDSLHHLSEYSNVEELKWVLANVKYLAHGKTIAVRPDTVIAYDKKLLAERKGTNVLFNDCHVEFVKPEELKKLGISATEILIEIVRLLMVSEDFLKDIGLDANSVHNSDAWSEHLVADSAAEPNSETYSLMLDELHISFLLKAVQAHQGSKMLVTPRVMTREGTTASIAVLTEEYYISGYNEPNRPSDKAVPKLDKVELGTRIWLKPELTPDNNNIKLDFKMEFRQLLGYEERKYKGKYIYLVPRLNVVSTKMPCLIPDGKTLLIGGLKMIKQVESRSGAPLLTKIPVIGGLFRSRAKIKDYKMLLVLVKPTINPQQKASKILRGQADSEEHIKSLARQLEKKLNPPAE